MNNAMTLKPRIYPRSGGKGLIHPCALLIYMSVNVCRILISCDGAYRCTSLAIVNPYMCFVDPSITWIDVMNCVSLAGCLAWQNFKVGCYMHILTNFFIPAMFIGIIDFYNFIPLSLTLTMAGGHKVSTKQNLSARFSCTFQLTRMKFDMVLVWFMLNIPILLLSEM